jgi:hypothetical protein
MRQVKIFKGIEVELGKLEAEMNAWIRQSGAQVVSITGNIAAQTTGSGSTASGLGGSPFPPSDVIVIVLYEAPEA